MTDLYRRLAVLAFLKDAREHPEDDTPRLALADWLDDHDDPHRAEFIRLQCRLAPGSLWPLAACERAGAACRAGALVARFGGGWLGPLWPRGGEWHRGLLSARLDRWAEPALLADVLPWVDSVAFEATGAEALRWLAGVLGAGEVNHLCLALRRPFREDNLLGLLGGLPESPCLRTLTLCWPPALAVRRPGGAVPSLSGEFFALLAGRLPLCRHLTHLGSSLPLTPGQERPVRDAGVEPVPARSDHHWPHSVPPAAFRRHGPSPRPLAPSPVRT
jgi:uncharacterized protein (TIGR02996 family)